jgi:hypothetical protein
MQFFVVFHRKLFDECYEKIPPGVLQEYFTFFAVNESIPKEYTPGKYKILNEWDLPIYDPTMQEKGYRENSAIYHVYANGLHKKYARVGFFQYDMRFNENIVDRILNCPVARPIGYFLIQTCIKDFVTSTVPNLTDNIKEVISRYEQHFSKPVLRFRKSRIPPFQPTLDTNRIYPLLNSYVIPSSSFETVMKWVVQLYGAVDLEGHTAGFYELIMAIALGEEDLEWYRLDVSHDQEFKKPCY